MRTCWIWVTVFTLAVSSAWSEEEKAAEQKENPGGITVYAAPDSNKTGGDSTLAGNETAENEEPLSPRRFGQMESPEIMDPSTKNALPPAPETPAPPPPPPPVLDESQFNRLTSVLDNQEVFLERLRSFDHLYQRLSDLEVRHAHALSQAGDQEGAKAAVEKARIHMFMAHRAYEIGLERYPDNATLLNGMGELLYDRFGEEGEAVTLWEKAARQDPKQSRSFNNLGIHYGHVGEYDKGIQNLDRALALEPDNPDYLFNLSQVYLVHWPHVMRIRSWTMDRVYTEAMALSARAVKSAPKDFDLIRDYAMNFFMAKDMSALPDWKTAIKAWQSARKVARTDEERFNTWLNEGRAQLRAGNLPKAQACFEEAIKIRPQSELVKGLLDDVRRDRARKK